MRPSTPLPLLALLLAFVAAMLSCPQPGDAQAPPAAEVPAAQAPTPDVRIGDLESLAATLEDEGKRGELLKAVQALIAAKQQAEPAAVPALGDRVLDYAAGAAREAQDAIAEAAGYFSDWPVLLNWIKREWSDPAARAKGAREAFSFVAIFVVGWLAELLLWRLLTGTRRHLDGVARRSGVGRVLPIVSRTLVDLLPPVAFFGAAYATALVVEPTRVVRAVSLNFVNAYLVARGLMAFTRLLLAPGSPALRLLPLADRLARDLFVWTRRFVYTAVTGYFVIAAAFLLGMPRRGADALLTGLGLALVVIAIVFVLRHRRPAASLTAS